MHLRFVAAVCLLLLLVAPTVPQAQEHREVGLALGYPPGAALLWHLSDRIALRPEVTFSWSSFDLQVTPAAPLSAASDVWTVNGGLSALVYVTHRESLRTYVAPRFAYGRTGEGGALAPDAIRSSAFSGSFGAQYSLSPRFAAFGEVGLGYTRTRSERELPIGRSVSTSEGVGIRSGAGVIFYF